MNNRTGFLLCAIRLAAMLGVSGISFFTEAAQTHAAAPISHPTATSTEPSHAGRAQSIRLAHALAALNAEPGFNELKNAALRIADADTQSTINLVKSARTQAVLPQLKFTAGVDLERDESLDQEAHEPDAWGADTDRDLGFQISAQWQLSELIFNPDLLRVYSTLSSRASDREELISMLAGYFFERRKLILINTAVRESDIRKTIEIKMRIEELTAVIDALTGGLLSRNLRAGKQSQSEMEP